MITSKVGDLLNDPDIHVICHQANLFHTFGSGIAAAIKKLFPEAYDADCATVKGDKSKLGTYSAVKVADGRTIVNCYSQTGMGATDRNTSYNDILVIFRTIEEKTRKYNDANPSNKKVIGVPYKFGSGLAGGSWRVVYAVFAEIFKNSTVDLVVVRLPSEPEIDIS